ncbi:MAG: DUF255 domain-containing protein [Akkermansiaceae bacterium]
MKSSLLLLPLSICLFLATSCDEKDGPSNLEKRRAEDLFFSNAAVSSLKDFKNEAANFQSDYLKLYKDDPIAWQAWDQTLEKKASDCQAPILLFVVSAVNGDCRGVVNQIYKDEELLNLLRDNNLCTLVDVHTNPEVALLAHSLSVDSRQQVSFPTLIWLSHEKLPIASFSVGMMNDNQLKTAVNNAATMVEQIWNNSSDYAVNNSRADNERRQERIDFDLRGESLMNTEEDGIPLSIPATRNTIYRDSTRKLISYFDPISQNFDGLGGILPASALELTGTASLSPRFTPQIRAASQRAFSETNGNIIHSAAKDVLDGGYFQSKRGQTWELPVFSKRLETQAQFSAALIRGGDATGDKPSITEGLALADLFASRMDNNLSAYQTSLTDPNSPGTFLWNWETLSEHLSEEELRLYSQVYGIRKFGNIPATIDPNGTFFKLNSLAQRGSWEELATKTGIPAESLQEKITGLNSKLLASRKQTASLFQETLISANQLSALGGVFHAAWAVSGKQKYLDAALTAGKKIELKYRSESGHFLRFPSPSKTLARGEDFSNSALFSLQLYQATLDEKWLKLARETTAQAINLLAREDFPLEECQPADRIIPIHIHNAAMIFGESTAGIFDQVYTRLLAITHDNQLSSRRELNTKRFRLRVDRIPIIFTDLLRSFALGDSPYLIAVSGNPSSPQTKTVLRELNRPHFSSFATLASASISAPELTAPTGGIAIGLYQNGKLLGKAANLDVFAKIFSTEMAKKE